MKSKAAQLPSTPRRTGLFHSDMAQLSEASCPGGAQVWQGSHAAQCRRLSRSCCDSPNRVDSLTLGLDIPKGGQWQIQTRDAASFLSQRHLLLFSHFPSQTPLQRSFCSSHGNISGCSLSLLEKKEKFAVWEAFPPPVLCKGALSLGRSSSHLHLPEQGEMIRPFQATVKNGLNDLRPGSYWFWFGLVWGCLFVCFSIEVNRHPMSECASLGESMWGSCYPTT